MILSDIERKIVLFYMDKERSPFLVFQKIFKWIYITFIKYERGSKLPFLNQLSVQAIVSQFLKLLLLVLSL